MSNPRHLKILRSGKKAWRKWRKENPDIQPNLSGAKLHDLDCNNLDLSHANLQGASLWGSSFRDANLNHADLTKCMARFVVFSGAKLVGAKLTGADLISASLRRADLTGADLRRCNLRFAALVGATVEKAKFDRAEVYGMSAWNLEGKPKSQKGIIIREKKGATTTTVDDLDTAQYLYLLRENSKIADIINTASQRTVLLLGRFAPEYKVILDALKEHLLSRNLVPILFDFDVPDGRDLTETVASLAHMACFVIPDLSGAKSVPQELSVIVPFLPSVPVLPIIAKENERVYSMFEHFLRYPWVHKPVRYKDLDHLMEIVDRRIIDVGYREAMKARGIKDAMIPPLPKAKRKVAGKTTRKTGTKRRASEKKTTKA